jgi:hypothetical protein
MIGNWFKKGDAKEKLELIRLLTFYEGRLLVLKSTPEQVRKYGSHFSGGA